MQKYINYNEIVKLYIKNKLLQKCQLKIPALNHLKDFVILGKNSQH